MRTNRAATGDSPNDDAKPLLALTPFPGLPQPGEPLKSEETSSSAITTDVLSVADLATEITYEIRRTGCDDVHAVDIQFASQILEGLRVSISGTDSVLSITFATQSNEVTALLSQHASELIDTLKADGLAIGNIRIVKEAGKNTDRGNRRWKGST
jgi:hypothetical protein